MSAREVRPGFKQSEVGVIPDDWEVKSLGQFVALQRGHDLTEPNRKPGLIRVMGSAGPNGFHDTALASGPGVVLGRSGASFGQAHFSACDFWPHNTALYVTDFFGNNRLFAFYLLKAIDFSRHNSGGAQQSLNRNFISPILIAVPKRDEQDLIVEALGDADALIDSLARLLAKKRNLKQGAMQNLLQPTAAWKMNKIGNTASLKARIGWQGLTTNEYLDSGDYYLVTGTDFSEGYIDFDHCHFVEKARYDQDKNIQLKQNDVLVTKDGTIGKIALINNLYRPATLNSGVFVIRPINESFDPRFLYYSLNSNIFDCFLGQLCAGSTISHLYQKDFVHFEFPAPKTIREQSAIAQTLFDIDVEIATLEQKLSKARAIKQGMMQQLLTGKVRLL